MIKQICEYIDCQLESFLPLGINELIVGMGDYYQLLKVNQLHALLKQLLPLMEVVD